MCIRDRNKDEQRPRLVYLSNCKNVLIADLNLQNSHFWTTHLYHCDHVKYLNCRIFSPASPVKAPSTDAIDIDVCSDILVKNCYLEAVSYTHLAVQLQESIMVHGKQQPRL